ncbi:sugar porter family MFS transporter [Sporobolomyces salmoneus]|uniref:sugar porter family MFS transporter n=1 Tax=Sporobolomyces salmoneus TaxID=183962 RepID=UPI00317E4C3A
MPTIRGAPIGGLAIAVAVFASIGGFLFGYDTGQIADFLVMDDFLLRFAECSTPGDVATCAFSNVRSGLIVAMLSIGTLFGALFGAYLADKFGRKKAVQIDCFVVIIGTIIQTASVSAWYQFMIGRIITGLGVGALSAVVPLYQSETAPKEIRGSLVATYQLMITFGILVAYCISIGTRNINQGGASWRIVVMLNCLWALILGVGFIFAPESPRWLFGRGRPEAAEKSLARIRGVKVEDNDYSVRTAYHEMEEAVQRAKGMKDFSWLDCFKPENKLLYRTVLLMVLQALQQLTGANYFFYYGSVVLGGVGIDDEFVSQIILGAVNFVCTFGGIYIMERFGRRTPLIIGGLWQSAWLFVYAIAGTVRDPITDQGIGKLMIVSTCLFIAGYATTWAPGVWTLVGETPRNDARAKTGALATSSNWLFNFLLAFCTPFITQRINYSYGFVFAGCNLAGAVIVFFFLYESSNLSLENVDRMYNDPNCKPWTSKKWIPEGHETRGDYANGRKAEGKLGGDKPQHRELADDDSHDGTYVGEPRTSLAKSAKH